MIHGYLACEIKCRQQRCFSCLPLTILAKENSIQITLDYLGKISSYTHPVHGHLDAAGLGARRLDVAVLAVDVVAIRAGRVWLLVPWPRCRRCSPVGGAAVEAAHQRHHRVF